MIYRIFVTIILVFTLTASINAQKKQHIYKADSAYKSLKFSRALDYYKKAYAKAGKDKKVKAEIMFKLGMCYKKINDTRHAISWFKRAVRYKYPDPMAHYYYADALRVLGNYDEAMIEFKAYLEKNPTDSTAYKAIEACELSLKWIENSTRYEVDIKDTRRLNSKQGDFSPFYADSKYRTLIFTSSRDGSKGSDEDAWTGESSQDLYFVKKDRVGRWKTPISFADAINSEDNEGAACLNKKGTVIYYTKCKKEKKKQMGCQIYKAQKTGKEWKEGEVVVLSSDTNDVIGHPALSPDETELYFASDMGKGYGGKDIWVVVQQGASFGEPKNLGPMINTPGDEMFPYVGEDGTLYFASNGHIGMGGLDIYKTIKIDGEWIQPENMKYPINSSYDDFGIVLEESNDLGYLSSTRKGGRGNDDIWQIYLPPLVFTLQGIVRDDSTQETIKNATVKITGTDGSSYIGYTDEEGKYLFNEMQILPNTTYELLGSHKGYFADKGKETTIGIERNTDLEHDFFLERIPVKPIELPEILYDFAKWDLKLQYQDSLNGLIETMRDNPSIIIELASHTDSRASLDYNDTLSQKRAQSVVDYLVGRGIAPDRMVAKGYGERVFKTLKESVIYPGFELRQGAFMKNDTIISGVAIKKGLLYTDLAIDSVVFERGTILDEDFIESLSTTREKELAHQLNRRTEFKVLSEDYTPKEDGEISVPEIQIIREEEIDGNQ